MKPAPAVIDTNVVVSGLVTQDPKAPTARILEGMLSGTFRFLLSPDLLREYRAVLLRPRIGKLHGLSEDEVDQVLTEIAAHATVMTPGGSLRAPDPNDSHLWNLLAAFPGAALVTGDQRLLDNPPSAGSVLSPRIFADRAFRAAHD